MARLFIGISLEDKLCQSLSYLQTELNQAQADIRWVAPKNIHLTVRFLGEVNPELIPVIKEILKATAGNYKVFELELRTLGAFPSVNNPRVIWIGCQDSTQQLGQIYTEIERKLLKLGLPGDDHKFTPHITLGRVKSSKNQDKLVTLIKSRINCQMGKQKVSQITLFHSQLHPDGPVYTVLETAPLREA